METNMGTLLSRFFLTVAFLVVVLWERRRDTKSIVKAIEGIGGFRVGVFETNSVTILVEDISCNLGWNDMTLDFGEYLYGAAGGPSLGFRSADA